MKTGRESSADSQLETEQTQLTDHSSCFVILKTNCSGIGAYGVEVHAAFPSCQCVKS